jgi:CspA family cold shock protein
VQNGTIKIWKPDRRFGFIRPDAAGRDLYFSERDCYGTPHAALRCRYEIGTDREGRTRATRVELVDE